MVVKAKGKEMAMAKDLSPLLAMAIFLPEFLDLEVVVVVAVMVGGR